MTNRRFDCLHEVESKPNSKTVKVKMIRVGVIITSKDYSSVNCTAMARPIAIDGSIDVHCSNGMHAS